MRQGLGGAGKNDGRQQMGRGGPGGEERQWKTDLVGSSWKERGSGQFKGRRKEL